MAPATTASPLEALVAFVDRLRTAGVPVSMVEAIDAASALEHIDVLDRRQLRAGLRAALIKRVEHEARFEALFDVSFAAAAPQPTQPAQPNADTDLRDALVNAVSQHDASALRALAQMSVDRYAGMDAQQAASEAYYLYRTLRQVDLANLLRRVRADRDRASGLDAALERSESAEEIENLRQFIAEAIRERLAETYAARAPAPPLEDLSLRDASASELKELRQAIRPLARKLAARMARRRQQRRRRGHLEVRRTLRLALSTGGVPLEPVFKRPRVSRPSIVMLSDISGSVAEFAEFTMALLDALRAEFARVRFFAFVDGVDDVTHIVERARGALDSTHLLAGTRVLGDDGHSDYGKVFARFANVYARDALDGKATLIVTGDARNNYRGPGVDAFRNLRMRAKRLYWLNPEPRAQWNATDSIMATYAAACDGVYEVSSLRDLEAFVDAIT